MEYALVGVCYDQRQRRILEITLPSWREYAHRHNLPLVILERSNAGEDHYWNKHLLFQTPELRSAKRLLFVDNDVFLNPSAGPLLQEWQSPLIGATPESNQAGWDKGFIDHYYVDYDVNRAKSLADAAIINTGVLVIPREQAHFLEKTYAAWKARRRPIPQPHASWKERFIAMNDQPHVSYALQAEERWQDFGSHFNTLWWHWYRRHVSTRQMPFLLRSKAASLTIDRVPGKLWRLLFYRERALFARALREVGFLHVAGSKSPLFLGEGFCVNSRQTR